MADATYQFGWHKFTLALPEPWEPGRIEGDDVKGYARIDDGFMPRLELKWDRAYGDDACDEAFRRYMKELTRAAGKGGAAQATRREPKEFDLGVRLPEGMRYRTVRWSAAVDCVAATVACSRCNRVAGLQILFPEGQMQTSLARRILESFRDHPESPDAPAWWGIYKMRFQTPVRWRLVAHRFGPGYAEMNFAGPGGVLADFKRMGPAEVLLKKRDLVDWYLAQLPQHVKVPREAVERSEVRGDVVLAATRQPRGLAAFLRRRGKDEVARRALCLQSVAWHCPRSNRLWAVEVYAPTLEAAREGQWQVFCHDEAVTP